MGVDILKLPLNYDGNQYVLVLVHYLTKWVEAFPLKDQKAEKVARIMVEAFVGQRLKFLVRFDNGSLSILTNEKGEHFWVPSPDGWLSGEIPPDPDLHVVEVR